MAQVIGIFICQKKGLPMQEVQKVKALAGVGLEGDRYASGKGTYFGIRHNKRHVTLIHIKDIEEANSSLSHPFLPIETRRNLLIDGDIHLLSLVGKEFSVGNVRMRGFEDCAPCKIPSKMAGKEGFKKAFALKGGLRAEILSDGIIQIADKVIV